MASVFSNPITLPLLLSTGVVGALFLTRRTAAAAPVSQTPEQQRQNGGVPPAGGASPDPDIVLSPTPPADAPPVTGDPVLETAFQRWYTVRDVPNESDRAMIAFKELALNKTPRNAQCAAQNGGRCYQANTPTWNASPTTAPYVPTGGKLYVLYQTPMMGGWSLVKWDAARIPSTTPAVRWVPETDRLASSLGELPWATNNGVRGKWVPQLTADTAIGPSNGWVRTSEIVYPIRRLGRVPASAPRPPARPAATTAAEAYARWQDAVRRGSPATIQRSLETRFRALAADEALAAAQANQVNPTPANQGGLG